MPFFRSAEYGISDIRHCERRFAMMPVAPNMPTIGEIARRLGVAPHRVEYVIRARGIKPCGWAGNARVFPEEAIESVALEMQRIETARSRERTSAGRD